MYDNYLLKFYIKEIATATTVSSEYDVDNKNPFNSGAPFILCVISIVLNFLLLNIEFFDLKIASFKLNNEAKDL